MYIETNLNPNIPLKIPYQNQVLPVNQGIKDKAYDAQIYVNRRMIWRLYTWATPPSVRTRFLLNLSANSWCI